jgi:hypothetical protein
MRYSSYMIDSMPFFVVDGVWGVVASVAIVRAASARAGR